MKAKFGASVQAGGGTSYVGPQAPTGAIPGNPGGQGSLMQGPGSRTMLFWFGFLAVLFVFHVGGARLP